MQMPNSKAQSMWDHFGHLVGQKYGASESEATEQPAINGESETEYIPPQGKGGEFCSPYTDKHGVHHGGFQCPLSWEDGSETEEVYCCGTAFEKFCCDEPTGGLGSAGIGAIVGGVFGFVILVVILVCLCCCCCSGCLCSGGCRRRSPVRRRRQAKQPTRLQARTTPTTRLVPAPASIPLTVTNNGHGIGNYPRQQRIQVPTLPPVHQQQPMAAHPPPPMPAAQSYPSPSHGYPPQAAAFAPPPQPSHYPPAHMGHQQPAYNPHHLQQPPMGFQHQQQYSPQQQYPPEAFGSRPISQPPPYEAGFQHQAEAPPLLDKGMPPPAMGGPSAPPPSNPAYNPHKH